MPKSFQEIQKSIALLKHAEFKSDGTLREIALGWINVGSLCWGQRKNTEGALEHEMTKLVIKCYQFSLSVLQMISTPTKYDEDQAVISTNWLMTSLFSLKSYAEAIAVGEKQIALLPVNSVNPQVAELFYSVAIAHLNQLGNILLLEQQQALVEIRTKALAAEEADLVNEDKDSLSFILIPINIQSTQVSLNRARNEAEKLKQNIQKTDTTFNLDDLKKALAYLEFSMQSGNKAAAELLADCCIYREQKISSDTLIVEKITDNKAVCCVLEYAIDHFYFFTKVTDIIEGLAEINAEKSTVLLDAVKGRYVQTIQSQNLQAFYYLIDDLGFPINVLMSDETDLRTLINRAHIPNKEEFISVLISRGFSVGNVEFKAENSEMAVLGNLNVSTKEVNNIITQYMGVNTFAGTNGLFFNRKKRKADVLEQPKDEKQNESSEILVSQLSNAATQIMMQ